MYKVFRFRFKFLLLFLAILLLTVLVFENAARAMFPVKFGDYVYRYAGENKLDPYIVFAIIKAESGFNPDAVSHKEARGLMQITRTTGEWASGKMGMTDYSAEKLFDPETNVRIGCWYLQNLLKQFDNDLDLALAAYNGGSGNVSEWLKDKRYSSDGKTLDKIPFGETDRYLHRVRNYGHIYKKLYEKGF